MTSMGPRQSTLQECGTHGRITKPISEKLTNSLVNWIVKNCRPVSTVEDDGLREVICLASGDTSYNLPSRGTIVPRINTLYEDERAQRTNMLEQAKHIALTGDHWTSVNNDNYLGVTEHFSDQDWTLQSFALTIRKTEERHYAEACANDFLDSIQFYLYSSKLQQMSSQGT